MNEPRAIRNNNPLNLRKTADRWEGLVDNDKERAFCVFDTMAHGFRAAFKTLDAYYHKHNLRTLHAIIWRWAPPAENRTCNYCHSVQQFMLPVDGWRCFTSNGQYLPAPADNATIWQNLALAMCRVECGSDAFARHQDELQQAATKGYRMAFG